MDEFGADTTVIRGFTAQLALGARWEDVLEDLRITPGVRNFVAETLDCAIHGSIVEVAAFFFFGREDVIPEMFERLLALWGNARVEVPHFAYYLERHIELDGGSHGPWSQEMLTTLAGQREAIGKRRPALRSGPSPVASSSGTVSARRFWTLKRSVHFAGH